MQRKKTIAKLSAAIITLFLFVGCAALHNRGDERCWSPRCSQSPKGGIGLGCLMVSVWVGAENRWSISGTNGLSVKFKSFTTKGHIDADTDDTLLILSGLFIKDFYLQAAFIVILIAVIIPAIG